MRIAIFGLTISSSWGNGHATLWRGLCKALVELGHEFVFFERDVPYYASSRDWPSLPDEFRDCELVLYRDWWAVRSRARQELIECDAAIVTSYCFDAVAAAEEIFDAQRPYALFYDLDTPITLDGLRAGKRLPYISERGLRDFDLVLSYTGGAALEQLRSDLGARHVEPLYGHVDPRVHRPVAATDRYRAALSWLGTYSADRQAMLEELFVHPATLRPAEKFLIGGAQYPEHFPWSPNVYFVHHVPPAEHAAFFSSSRLTLNVTREPMARMGWCPSGRLFEAAACGAAVLSDQWCGLEDFYSPGEQILTARSASDTLAALDMSDAQLAAIGRAARERTLDEHTSRRRALQLVTYLEQLQSSKLRQFHRERRNSGSQEDLTI
jgi:spore maturation protein CgeB